MRVLVKNDNRLLELGEGKMFSKSQLRLNEDVTASLGSANGIQAAQMKAKQLMAKNPNVDSASSDAGKLDGKNNQGSGEGVKLQVPINASGSQLANAQNMVNNKSNDDMEIEFTKNTPNDNNTNNESKEYDRLKDLRENSIPFTKDSLAKFLRTI